MNATEKIIEALKGNKKKTISQICREIKITFAHGNTIKFRLLEKGIIEKFPRDKRSDYLRLK